MTNSNKDSFLIIGHRGAKGHIIENSLESFQKAFELGANGIELDVYCCQSGELIVFHDYNLRRFGGKGEVEQMTLSEIRQQNLIDNLHIPTLSEVLEMCDENTFINIEIKGKNVTESLLNLLLLKDHSNIFDRVVVSSFHWGELEKLRIQSKDIKLGILVYNPLYFRKALRFADKLMAFSLHPRFDMCSKKRILKMKKRRLKIYPWTVNNFEDLASTYALNVDGIITDYPDRLKQIVRTKK